MKSFLSLWPPSASRENRVKVRGEEVVASCDIEVAMASCSRMDGGWQKKCCMLP